jgi:hypothetical protein
VLAARVWEVSLLSLSEEEEAVVVVVVVVESVCARMKS